VKQGFEQPAQRQHEQRDGLAGTSGSRAPIAASALVTKLATNALAISVMSPVRPNCAIVPDS
jgi:hypothetical protein